ncbi:acetyl-CoA synthetase-like protein, partial [Atractiella rhizophila]
MAIEAWNEEGKKVAVGESGELVCIKPFPAMPIRFWPTTEDPDGMQRYRAAYFGDFEGVWKHGDYCIFTERGGIVMLGRSDAVLNPSGVRFGSAEIYEVLEGMGEAEGILDSLAVGQPIDEGADERVVLFLVMQEGHLLDEERAKRHTDVDIRRSPRHVPAVVLQVQDIPYT